MPVILLTAAVIMIITMAGGSYIDLRSDEMHSRHLLISTGLEKIVRFTQELNGMLRVSVLEQNTLRSSSYQTVHNELEYTFLSIENLTQGTPFAGDILALSAERQELHIKELEALKLMQSDQWDQAHALLFSDSYTLARKIYEINSDTTISALNGDLETTASTFRQVRSASILVRIAALGLLFWSGLMFSNRIRREMAEQERLKQKLGAANLHLEDMVQERTAELEEANRKLESLSLTDALTGLANRRRFDEVMQAEWQRARRVKEPLAIMMIDVDHFKSYNDHFGHQAGDIVLQQISTILKDHVRRSSDLAARYGGEEFVLVLPRMDQDEAEAQAEVVRSAIEESAIPHIIEPQRVVTVSIGVSACVPQSVSEVRALLLEADRGLYNAKKGGKNRVSCS